MDYSARMETILAEMRTLFTTLNSFFCGSPILLEKVPNLTEFPDLPQVDMLQNLHTPTTLRTNPKSKSGERKDPGSDARSKDAKRTQPEEVSTPALDSSLPLPTKQAPPVPSPLAPSPGLLTPQSGPSLPIPSLIENARLFAESVRRQVALIQSLSFQDLLSRT